MSTSWLLLLIFGAFYVLMATGTDRPVWLTLVLGFGIGVGLGYLGARIDEVRDRTGVRR